MAADRSTATPLRRKGPGNGVVSRLPLVRNALLAVGLAILAGPIAGAQQADPIGNLLRRVTTPQTGERPNLSVTETTALRSALAAARAGDLARFQVASPQIDDVDARRLATWAMIDAHGEAMSFFEVDQARRDLAGWPRGARRQVLAEEKLVASGLEPQAVVDWFGADKPQTGEGALALATALMTLGRNGEAQAFAREAWRTKVFEADTQTEFLNRLGGALSSDDHVQRADMLLYGAQGPAARALLPLLPPDQRALAEARIALRTGARNAQDLVNRVPASLASSGGLVFEKAYRATRSDQDTVALRLAGDLPSAPGFDDGDQRLYSERRNIFVSALQAQDYDAAYKAMNNAGFASGVRRAESEFFAGWVALTKLHRPAEALRHFQSLKLAGATPLTQGRALYWMGRAAEESGDQNAALSYYREGSQYIGAFYGQLAAEKAGITTLTLPPEPQPTEADRARFESRSTVRAAHILVDIGETDLFKVFIGVIDDNLPTPEEYALLMDMTRDAGEPFLAMMAGRAAAGRGFLLPERMYPLRTVPDVPNAPDAAFVMAITRQESSFDPKIRSSADARGMMMLLPSTARIVARQLGVPYSAPQLYDEDYNMKLGTFHLGQLMGQQSGSFLLTAVGYNAGPARPAQWTAYCGDPRATVNDPLDFIECVPFTETRDYMMRVMENVQIYRARLNGGSSVVAPMADLKRGGYGSVATN